MQGHHSPVWNQFNVFLIRQVSWFFSGFQNLSATSAGRSGGRQIKIQMQIGWVGRLTTLTSAGPSGGRGLQSSPSFSSWVNSIQFNSIQFNNDNDYDHGNDHDDDDNDPSDDDSGDIDNDRKTCTCSPPPGSALSSVQPVINHIYDISYIPSHISSNIFHLFRSACSATISHIPSNKMAKSGRFCTFWWKLYVLLWN